MSVVETPSHDALLAEQSLVQAEKFQGRQLGEYNSYMFPGQSWREPRGSAVTDLLRPLIPEGEPVVLESILKGIRNINPDRRVTWVDMGGGRALPMRQLAAMGDTKSWLQMTNVDLFDYGLDGLENDEVAYLEELAPGMTRSEVKPELITENAEIVKLPQPPDVITSVEGIQYLNDPLVALTNWYNQLANNGVMIVATEHDWPSWIRYKQPSSRMKHEDSPTEDFLNVLAENGIPFGATDEPDWPSGRPGLNPNRFRILAVQKKPDTYLNVTQPLNNIWVNPYYYKATFYEKPIDSRPLIEVTKPLAQDLGKASLSRAELEVQ